MFALTWIVSLIETFAHEPEVSTKLEILSEGCHGAICSVHHFDTNIQVEWYATFLLLTSIVFMYIFFEP